MNSVLEKQWQSKCLQILQRQNLQGEKWMQVFSWESVHATEVNLKETNTFHHTEEICSSKNKLPGNLKLVHQTLCRSVICSSQKKVLCCLSRPRWRTQIFILPVPRVDFITMHLRSVKLITTTSIPMSYRAEVLSYVDLIKLCRGELIRSDLHLEMFLCSVPPETSRERRNHRILMTWQFLAGVFPSLPQRRALTTVVSAHQSRGTGTTLLSNSWFTLLY